MKIKKKEEYDIVLKNLGFEISKWNFPSGSITYYLVKLVKII